MKEHLAQTLWALVLGGEGEAYGLGLGTVALAGTTSPGSLESGGTTMESPWEIEQGLKD